MMIFKDTPKAYLYFLFDNIWLFALFILFTGKESLQKIKPNALMLKKKQTNNSVIHISLHPSTCYYYDLK